MNSLILKDKSGTIQDPKVLTHLHTTLKVSVGDNLKCTILGHGHSDGIIEEISQTHCKIKLGSIIAGAPQWFNLIVGLSRPQTSKKILEHATTFGAKKIHFFKAALSEKSYLDSKIFEQNAYEEFLINGLSQAALFSELPEFTLDKYNPASQYMNINSDISQKFILDLEAKQSFLDMQIDWSKPITLAIGPERGWVKEDLDAFKLAGFTSVKISSSILRVEHAVYSAISQLELLRNRF